jgi:hypothetical protein
LPVRSGLGTQQVRAWARTTSRLDPRGGLGFWRDINARAGLGLLDYDDCFLVRTRQVAAEADLVVSHPPPRGPRGEGRRLRRLLRNHHVIPTGAPAGEWRPPTGRAALQRCRELADDVDRKRRRAPITTTAPAAARQHATDLFDVPRAVRQERLRAEL